MNNSVPLAQSYSVTALADYLNGQTTPAVLSSTPTQEQLAIAQANSTTKTGQEFYSYVGNSVAQNGFPRHRRTTRWPCTRTSPTSASRPRATTPPADPQTISTMNQAASDAANMLQTMGLNTGALPGGGATPTGWTVNTSLGEYAATYNGWITSAVTSYVGTIANLAVDGTYPQTTIDGDGNPLNGANQYTISFPAGDLSSRAGLLVDHCLRSRRQHRPEYRQHVLR